MVDAQNQETIIADLDSTPAKSRISSRSAWKWAANFVEGTGLDFSNEINTVLSQRLKISSLILFVSFLAFYVKNLIFGGANFGVMETPVRIFHFLALAVNGIVALRLCTNCSHLNRHLRIVEVLIFGCSTIFFLVVTYGVVVLSASRGFLYPVETPWLILIFIYALFIPNSWQRAFMVTLTMGLAPIAVMGVSYVLVPEFREIIHQSQNRGILVQSSMAMMMAVVVATWGVWTIRSLRAAAFEAKKLGQYRLKRLLGRGGMGEVHLAEHTLLKRPCAIKLIRPEMAGKVETLKRFEREVQATAQLTHWNTIEIYDYGMAEDGTFYYVMEYLPGLNIDQIVAEHGPMPASRAIHFLKQTCDALSEAHAKGLVHRDIKPANIFAAKRGGTYDVGKLLDFGLVRSDDRDFDAKLTQEGRITGSPLYMSPEQATGDDSDARSDIYSLGGVAYYLLTGEPPFQETKPVKLILAHVQTIPPKPSTICADVPADLEAIVMKCLSKDPKERYQSVDELRDALVATADNGLWNRQKATDWWQSHGCPRRQFLEECILHGKELPESDYAEAGFSERTNVMIGA